MEDRFLLRDTQKLLELALSGFQKEKLLVQSMHQNRAKTTSDTAISQESYALMASVNDQQCSSQFNVPRAVVQDSNCWDMNCLSMYLVLDSTYKNCQISAISDILCAQPNCTNHVTCSMPDIVLRCAVIYAACT